MKIKELVYRIFHIKHILQDLLDHLYRSLTLFLLPKPFNFTITKKQWLLNNCLSGS